MADTTTAVALHRRRGTTTLIASLVSAGPVELASQISELADQVAAGLIAGCEKLLGEAEQKVVKLKKGADGTPQELPFDDVE